ncbi:hypothetical protein G5V59_08840 [Nocardioides sp. W3-2-3]|uniref:hypothetical protein n=1 Tax=Nocardioides convexus TaxID=2712224 RepID=UPI002418A5B1|nr:hypothetical protein [Nocardioides convexus]NHA00198.1 hypothetical protein [Nocardioides convexus]
MGRTGQSLRRKTAQTIGQRSSGTGQAHGSGSGWGARLRYGFDNTMSRGTPALVGWLFVVTVALVLLFAVIDVVFRLREGGIGFADASFQALMHALDPGTVAGDTGSWRFKITMLVLTIAGLFIVSALIGVIAAGIDARIADLRRGRSVVLEKEHTVILGWSDSVFTVISEPDHRQREPPQAGDRRPRTARQGGHGGRDPGQGAGPQGHARRRPLRLADRHRRPRPGQPVDRALGRRALAQRRGRGEPSSPTARSSRPCSRCAPPTETTRARAWSPGSATPRTSRSPG